MEIPTKGTRVYIKNVRHLEALEDFGLGYPRDQMVLTSTMALHGLRSNNNLDIIVGEPLWTKLADNLMLAPVLTELDELSYISMEHSLEFYRQWSPGPFSFDHCMAESIAVDGWHFLSLDMTRTWKLHTYRPKDRDDVKLIKQYLERN